MKLSARPGELAVVSFVALSIGFMAGWWLAPKDQAGEPQPTATGSGAPHPVGADDHIQLGLNALAAGDFEEAELRFRRAGELRPEDPAPRANLAVALLYQEEWEEADAEIEEARELGPGSPELDFLEGVVARDGFADTARAREAWRRYLEQVPEESPESETVRGWLDSLDTGS